MASLDEELLHDEEENRREIAFIRGQLANDLKEKFTDDELQFIIDAIGTYFYTSGILETADDEVEIDLDTISEFVCNEAKEEGEGPFESEDVFFVVQADLDFQEQNT
jgi:aspartate/tyrosine/aromatic aminotransferase